jgi:hypothetical protein
MDVRPDGPLFGLVADGKRHLVAPSFVRGREDGWFNAYCYVCRKHERFEMLAGTFHNPFTGETVARTFGEALTAGSAIRAEWIRRRKAARQS